MHLGFKSLFGSLLSCEHVAYRLDDICSGVAHGKQESCDRQLAVSLGLSGVVQQSVGDHADGTDVSVVASTDSRPKAPKAVDGIKEKRVAQSAESAQ